MVYIMSILRISAVSLQVGARVVAKPSTKQYGILSVAFQLYSTPKMNFKIPASVFFPKPKVSHNLDACFCL